MPVTSCPSCGHENRPGRKFCSDCGTELGFVCTACGTRNEPGERYCGECGQLMTAGAAPLPSQEKSGPTPTQEPESFAGGRYSVTKFLGEGGKKKVYLARDSVLDRGVAFALIKTEGLDETARTRVAREAQAMGRLGSHPHIVTVFDLGEEGDQPFMVTELMEGGDVEGLIEQAPDHVPLEKAIEIAKEICEGLEFAHAKQLVHRDLKPGNIWLTEDGVAKIGDFGLALAQDRSRLTAEGLMVGTVAYMPPEQALGGEVSRRSDLYSLGAMLYELVTGRPPFVGDESVAIISQHINTPPVAPTWHNADCPRSLEALIMRLLAKDPSERPETAADVLRALEAIDVDAVGEETESRAEEEPSLDRLAAGVFVGRQKEMSELKAALEDGLSGQGRLAMLAGEPGIGKTRTALELATYARLRRAQVLSGRCYEGEGAPPYWPWVQVIRSYVRECEPEQLRSEMGTGAAEIAELVSDVRQRLPDVGPPPALEDPKQARFRLFDAITAFLRSASSSQPLVLFFDDLHWADNDSLALLEFVARELAGARLLILGTYRDVELSRRHPLSQTLAELTREHLGERILLRGLGEADVGRFIEATSGIVPPSELVEAVHMQTEGNPLFVTEVVRLLVQEGTLTPERLARGERWSVGIPEGIRQVIGRRLDRLSERCNDVLTVAAVIGREFGFGELSRLIEDLSDERLLEVLEEALAARVVEELPRAAERYQFTHALIQDVLEDELSTTRRVRLHAQIAPTLEELYGADAEAHAAELAHHYAEAESLLGSDKLVHYSQVAGERALAARAYEEAAGHFERALSAKEGQPEDAESAELRFGLGRAQLEALRAHDLGRAVANMTRAFNHYVEAGELDRAIEVATHPVLPSWSLSQTEFGEMVKRALEFVDPDTAAEGRLLITHGWFLNTVEADYDGARRALDRALVISEQLGNPALARSALAATTQLEWTNLELDQCLKTCSRLTEFARQAGDERSHMVASLPMSRVLTAAGKSKEARSYAASALDTAERFRDRWWLATAGSALAGLSALEGDWPGARDVGDLALAGQPSDARVLGPRALVEYQVGEFQDGAVYLDRMQEAAEQFPPPGPLGEHALAIAFIPLLGRISGLDERNQLAEALAQKLLALPLLPVFRVPAQSGLALLAVQREQTEAAESFYAALESQRGSTIPLMPISADRLLGLLALTLDRIETAVNHFQDALAFCNRAGYRAEYAWTASDYAEALLQHAAGDDREKAARLQEESLVIARELGMPPLIERVLARREILNA